MFNTNAIQGLKNESHADTSIYKKNVGQFLIQRSRYLA